MIDIRTNIKINTNGDNIEKKLKNVGTVGGNPVLFNIGGNGFLLLLFIIN